MATVGNGAYSYEPVENWAKLPPGWSFKEIGGVGVNDNVFVFNRGEHPMIVFDREGNFLRSFGEGLFPRAHGVFMTPDDTVWLTDSSQTLLAITRLSTYCRCALHNTARQRSTSIGIGARRTTRSACRIGTTTRG
jgi:hypothetical protein